MNIRWTAACACCVGAGTGGLTANLLPMLPPERTDYLFSDISGSIR